MIKTLKKSTDPNDLERKILDPNIAKNEAEWWARERILELEKVKEPPTAYTRLWQAIVGLCVMWVLGFAIWGMFK